MKKLNLALTLLVALASCKKSQVELPEEVKLSPDIDLVVKGATQETMALYPSSETYNFLGFGYDVTDKFDDETSVRANVVDIPVYATTDASRVDLSRSTESSWRTIQAINAVDLSEKFSNFFTNTKGLRVFGNTLGKTFSETIYTDKKYIYGYYSYYMIRKRFRFYYDQRVNNFITNNFKKDVALLSAEELVKKYGTHVLIGVKIGAKLDVVYQAIAPSENREYIGMEGLRYALKRTFGLTTGYLDDVQLWNLNANSSAQIYYSSVGGDINKLKPEIMNNNRVFVNINNWIASTTEEKARFMGPLDNNHGLEPIYSFVDDSDKKAALKAYIEQYIADKTVKLTN